MFKSSYRLILLLVNFYPIALEAEPTVITPVERGANSLSVSIVYPDRESCLFTRSYNLSYCDELEIQDQCLYLSYSAGRSRSGDPDIVVDLNPGDILYGLLEGILDDYEIQYDLANGDNSMGVD
jgi:hypothetical protein